MVGVRFSPPLFIKFSDEAVTLLFFYIFMIAKAVGSENKAKWFKRRMKYTFFNKRGIFGEYINFGYPITWQGVGIFVAIYGVIFGFGYWYVFIHAYN